MWLPAISGQVARSHGPEPRRVRSTASQSAPESAVPGSTRSRRDEPGGCNRSRRNRFLVPQAVEHVPFQWPLMKVGMIEIVFGRPGHPEALHDPARAPIGRSRQRDDLLEAELLETIIERRLGCLGSVALAPIGPRESPSNLDCRREVSLIGDRFETDDADEARLARELGDPLAKAMLLPMSTLATHPAGQRQEVLYDDGIGGKLGEGRIILIAPLPQQQPGSPQEGGHGYFFLPSPPRCDRNIS